ncbi:MAG: hypothetical protein KDC44_07185, partial [Phaeodactylibacter sp.]|nr:hypothetical protein [Phaeodactylibacter sp.]
SEMTMFFEDRQIEKIKFYNNPTGKFIPMQEADHAALKLTGFFWEVQRRPKVLADLFTVREIVQPLPTAAPEEEDSTMPGKAPEAPPLPPKPKN